MVMHDFESAPRLCKSCAEIIRHRNKKKNAKPGVVEVVYGVCDPTKEDGGRRFAYYYHERLSVGDLVLVPATPLDNLDGYGSPKEATVVCTYSDYDGEVRSIIRVVRKGGQQT